MADDRLVLGVSAWLRDSDVPAPDAHMSASRVMAGVEVTERLGRFWPPARLAPDVQPAPALGDYGPEGPPPRPQPRVRQRRLKARAREVLTPVRVLAVASVVALTGSVVLLAASFLPSSAPEQPPLAAAALTTQATTAPGSPAPTATPMPTATPAPTPTPAPTWRPSERALDWHSDDVRLEAESLRLVVGDRDISGPALASATGSTDASSARLDVSWAQEGVEQRLVVEIAADDAAWWVERIRTLDGRRNGRWIDFAGLAEGTRTPLGRSWTGDLRARSTGAERKVYRQRGSARLIVRSLRLSAFGPEGIPPAD